MQFITYRPSQGSFPTVAVEAMGLGFPQQVMDLPERSLAKVPQLLVQEAKYPPESIQERGTIGNVEWRVACPFHKL